MLILKYKGTQLHGLGKCLSKSRDEEGGWVANTVFFLILWLALSLGGGPGWRRGRDWLKATSPGLVEGYFAEIS